MEHWTACNHMSVWHCLLNKWTEAYKDSSGRQLEHAAGNTSSPLNVVSTPSIATAGPHALLLHSLPHPHPSIRL